MSMKLASLNVRLLSDQGKAASLYHDLVSFRVDVTMIQETDFVYNVGACVLSRNFVFYLAYGVQLAKCVSLLVKCSMDMRLDLVHIYLISSMVNYYEILHLLH